MLMANLKAVLQRPKVAESHERNAFDRSFSPKVHYQTGGLQPFMAEPLIAGSHIKLNRSIFQRTAAVNTAAFPKVDTHVEFFFVPMRLLWTYWNNFKLNIQDFGSSQMGTIVNGVFTPFSMVRVPEFDLVAVQNEIVSWNMGLPSSQFTPQYFISGPAEAVGANRLLDCLGYGYVRNGWTFNPQTPPTLGTFKVNPFKLLAYQKIYMDHFRNTAYESNDPTCYNVDAWTTQLTLPPSQVEKMCTYRYVNYRKDYFQSVYPALNYTVSSPTGLQWSIPDSVMYQLGGPYGNGSVTPSQNSGGQVMMLNDVTPTSGYNAYSVQQIRAAFAMDKLLRASAYAPKHVKDQFEARYGVKGVENDKESIRIGAFMNDIVFQEVTSTANTGSTVSNLGEIGGKGVGYSGYGKDIEFTAKEDGIVMGLIYSLPRTSYDSDKVSNWNAKSVREDFFIPEYMDLGMQPLPWFEQRFKWDSLTNVNNIIGYKDRYSEYKVGIDVNHGMFNSGELLSDFVTHSNSRYYNIYGQSNNGVSSSYFKVAPSDLDAIFVQNSNPNDVTTDKFFTYLDIKFIVNQNMSIHGQPRIGGLS